MVGCFSMGPTKWDVSPSLGSVTLGASLLRYWKVQATFLQARRVDRGWPDTGTAPHAPGVLSARAARSQGTWQVVRGVVLMGHSRVVNGPCDNTWIIQAMEMVLEMVCLRMFAHALNLVSFCILDFDQILIISVLSIHSALVLWVVNT